MQTTTLRTIEVSGTPHERGRQYGQAAADLIDKALEYYQEAFGQQTGLNWEQVKERATAWLSLCERSAPDILEEVRGVAEGSGHELLDILVLNLRGEIIYNRSFGAKAPDRATEERDDVDGCTSFVLTEGGSGDGHVYAGQNWDWRAGTQGTVLVLRVVQDPLPTLIMQVEAGQIGRHGANSAGIALNANGLGGRFNAEIGLPQTFIRRMALNQSELNDALNVLVRNVPHIASNAVLSHRSGTAIDLETTPQGVGWLYPEAGMLVHGNHFQAQLPAELAGRYRPISADSLLRVPRATALLARVRHSASREESLTLIRQAMSDHLGYPESVCTHPDDRRPGVRQWSTLLSSCVDLTTGDYFVTNGTPCSHEYERMPWNVFDGPGSRFGNVPTQPMEAQ